MDFDLNISPWLISSIVGDLNQTSDFTGRGLTEANPFAKPLVEGKSSIGEVGLGLLGTGLALNKDIPEWVKALWAIAHTGAILHNRKSAGSEIPPIMVPLLTARW